MSMLTAELLTSFDDSVRPVTEACALPAEIYTSDEFYAFEKEAIFSHSWLCLGRTDQVPEPGDYFTITMVDEPLMVVRGDDGVVRVLSAVCRHRGMVLIEDKGNCDLFMCPYHQWTYARDGQLVNAPAMTRSKDFDKSKIRLPEVNSEIWNGFVFVNFGNDAPPLGPSLAKVGKLLEHYDLGNAVTIDGGRLTDLPWNWKVMLENFNDPYHASRLHGRLQDFAPSNRNEFLPWDDTDNAIGRIQHFVHPDGSFNPTQHCIMPIFPKLTDEERAFGMFILIPPTLGLAIVPDEVTYFVIEPRGADVIDIGIGYIFDRKAPEVPRFEYLFEAAKAGVNNFNVQDVYADTMVQRGLASRFAPRGRYSWQEETLQQFNRWLVTRYRQHWPMPAARPELVALGPAS